MADGNRAGPRSQNVSRYCMLGPVHIPDNERITHCAIPTAQLPNTSSLHIQMLPETLSKGSIKQGDETLCQARLLSGARLAPQSQSQGISLFMILCLSK